MTITKQILDYLTQNPKQTATQVRDALNIKNGTAKITLGIMAKKGRLIREMVPVGNYVRGPRNVAVYSCPSQ
jgi:DNA-binding MarR family transcriptional regulator